MEDKLQDLARNSMDSVGVSGGGHVAGSQIASLSSLMPSSLLGMHLELKELTERETTHAKEKTVFIIKVTLL